MFGSKPYEYYYETDEASPTQEKMGLNVAFGPLFPTQSSIFSWAGVDFYIGKRPHETLDPTKFSGNTLLSCCPDS